jgi:CheY-like chemotaxis protein
MKKIIIVEDDDIQVFILKKYLSNLNQGTIKVEFFENGLEAINHIKAHLNTPELLPDKIILDINMPLLNGWQFLTEFHTLEISKDICIDILTSSENPSDIEQAKYYNLQDHYHLKPIHFEEFKILMMD